MNQRILHKVLVWGFLFLYLLVAGISFCHAVEFFSIGNLTIMSAVLAFAFELGLSLSLAAILLSNENKNKLLPWILMTILTFVQVVGNVYSTFKYIALSDVDYYVYLQNPLLFWIEEVSQDTVQVIISWIIGAILPIVALFMTDMVASNLKNMQNDKSNINEEVKETPQEKEEETEQEEIEIPEVSEVHDEPKEQEKDVSLKNVVVHDEPIKTSIENQEPVKKEPAMKINKNVETTEEPVKTEDEVANRDKEIEIPEVSEVHDEPKEQETGVSLKNVVVHDEPIKTSIEKQEPVKKEPAMKINKNVKTTEEPVKTEDEVANRDKKIKNGYHRADDPYFDLPTSNK